MKVAGIVIATLFVSIVASLIVEAGVLFALVHFITKFW
jgi:hypothetical protein